VTPYHFVHLGLLALGEEIRGSTRLQKTMYFLGLLTNSLDRLGYRPHYYGPYSDAVADAVNDLVSLGFVARNSQTFGGDGNRGFERIRHDYRLTEEGREIAQKKADDNPVAWQAIQAAARKFREASARAGNPDYMRLSVAAKTYHLLGQRGTPAGASSGELSLVAKELGWDASPDDIEASKRFLREAELVPAAA